MRGWIFIPESSFNFVSIQIANEAAVIFYSPRILLPESAHIGRESLIIGEEKMKKRVPGTQIKPFMLQDIHGNKVHLPEAGRWTHLQFRRYSGCVICNLHLQEIINRQTEIKAAGINEVIFFQSSQAYLLAQFSDKPVNLIADAELRYYREFGVENSLMSIANPTAWWPGFTAMFKFGIQLPKKGESPLGLPADFLMDDQGKLVAVHYGKHAYDQWSVDHLLNLVKHEGVVV